MVEDANDGQAASNTYTYEYNVPEVNQFSGF